MPPPPYYPSYLSYLLSQLSPSTSTDGELSVFEPPAIPSSSSLRPQAIEEFRRSWRVLCAALFGMLFCCLPGSAIGVFIAPWADANGWSLSSISGFAVWLGLGAVISEPFVGRLMDRFGGRLIALIYIPVSSCVVAATSFIGHTVWSLYLVMLVWGLVGAGAGTYIRAVNVWFTKARGAALGISLAGVGLSGAIAPRLSQWIVDAYGWRAAYLALAAISLLAWPFAFLWLHEKKGTSTNDPKAVPLESGYTREEALKTTVFWLIGGSWFFSALTAGGGVFLAPFLNESMSREGSASCAAMLGVSATIAQPLFGLVIDWLHAPFVAAGAFLAYALAFTVLGLFGSGYAVPAVILIGVAQSAWISCSGYCVARYFGLKCFGEILGLVGRMGDIGVMLGPVIFAVLRDATGAYTFPYVSAGLFAALASIFMVIAGRRPFFFENASRAIAAPAGGSGSET